MSAIDQTRLEHLEAEVKALRGQLDRERADATAHEREECARLVERFAAAYPGHRSVLGIVVFNIRDRVNRPRGGQ